MDSQYEIEYCEKPSEVSWKTIWDVLQQAHQSLFESGIVMYTTTLTVDELEKRVQNNNGKCYIATCDDKVVGTASLIYKNLNRWYYKGISAEYTLLGVLPSFQGRHIASKLTEIRDDEIVKMGYNSVYFSTAAGNSIRIKMAKKQRFQLVGYHFYKGQYYVEMMKWMDKCPFSKLYCTLRYSIQRVKTHMHQILKPRS